MKTIVYCFLILLFCPFFFYGQNENAIFPGEKLTYTIHIGFIHAAQASIQTASQAETISGKKAYKIEVYGKTTGVFNVLTPVEDYWSAYLQPESLLPIKTEFKKRELNYRKQETVWYQHEKEKAKVYSQQNNPTDKIFEITKSTKDLIGGYFSLRDQAIRLSEPGSKLRSKVFMDSQMYDLLVLVKGKEIVENILGKKSCVKTSMVLPKNNLFEDKEAIKIWITDDPYQIPYKIEVALKFGTLSIDLIEYKIGEKQIY